jgi:hypothetical protein
VGQIAAAAGGSPPVFCRRRGILAERSEFAVVVSMKKKSRKHGKVPPRARRVSRAVHEKQRAGSRKEQVEWKPVQWLRMIPTRLEGDLKEYIAAGLFSERNGRRRPRKLDLRVTEVK